MRGDGARRLIALLESVQREDPSIMGLLLADGSGLPIADSFRESMDLMAVSAMSTLILQSASTVFHNLKMKGGTGVILQGDKSVILVRSVTAELSLIMLADRDANLGLLNLRVERVGEQIKSMLMEV